MAHSWSMGESLSPVIGYWARRWVYQWVCDI